jgi:hypothetical protein
MRDVHVVELAARQYNRFSRGQVLGLGITDRIIEHRLSSGAWTAVHDGVYAIAPALDLERSRFMAATLTERFSVLSHASSGALWGWWDRPRDVETVTRPGSGGPRKVDGVRVHRSDLLRGDWTTLHGIPVTTVPRTLVDLAAHVPAALLARCVREAIRLETTTVVEIMEALTTRYRGRRGSRRLKRVVTRYAGLPLDRARSGTEVRALVLLRDASRPMPELNAKVAGVEADLVWRSHRLIVELDGGPFHLDRGEDARKEAIWRDAGFTVRRLASEEVRDEPEHLLAIAPNVHQTPT